MAQTRSPRHSPVTPAHPTPHTLTRNQPSPRHARRRLEPNAYRSEGATALARVHEMKGERGAWQRSNIFIREHVGQLSEELRDLLDRILVGDESERITLQVGAAKYAPQQ